MDNKNDLRIKAKEIRKNLDINLISRKIITKIRNLEIYKNSKNIMIFYPLNNEINLLDLLKESDKSFYLPRTKDDNMEACPYKIGDKLVKGDFNITTPISNAICPQNLDLIFVPALMVDENNYRLGYGKGFYDKFLEKTSAKTIVPIAKELIIKNLPIENHDKKIDIIITE